MLKPSDLSIDQVRAYKDILTKKILCNCSGCGFGKTITALTAFVVLKRKFPDTVALIVSNSEGVKNAWTKEHHNWTHTKHLNVVVLIGTPVVRLKKLKDSADAYVITYNNLKWLLDNNIHDFNFIIADEAECLKGSSSQWRKTLTKIAPNARYKYLLSATPKPREEDDYWGLCKYMDGGKRLGETISDFRHKYMRSYSLERRVLWKMRNSSKPIIEDKIKDIFINYNMSEAATIPIKTISCYANLSRTSQEKYDLLEKEQCINSIVNDGKRKPLTSLTVSGKLNQLSSGFLYVDEKLRIDVDTLRNATNLKSLVREGKKQYAADVFTDRIDAFAKLLIRIKQRHGDQNLCICYNFKHELEQLKRLLPAGISDKEDNIEDRWNEGTIKYLFLQYSRSAKALNLQKGGFIMAFYSLTFKWGDNYQIIRRLARQGQSAKVVYAYRLYMRNTIDEMKTKRLDERFKGHARFQKLIRSKHSEIEL